MPTRLLLRSYLLTSILASPRILKLGLPLLNRIANSESTLLNPDRNPVLHMLLRNFVYDHFTAGETETEVRRTVAEMKRMGLKGVILGYAKEVNVMGKQANSVVPGAASVGSSEEAIQAWTEGTLKTLSMIGEGDFLALKLSGGGPSNLSALARGQPPPASMQAGIHEICAAAAKQKSLVWMDAEQQKLQPTIEDWTIELMRQYNRNENPLIYTTMQAYLKRTPENILKHLKLAQEEGWTLGMKLVRGAYISTEQRSLIHDTIEDTHAAYNNIATQLLQQTYPGLHENKPFPRISLFLATHNAESINKAYALQKSLVAAGKPTIPLAFGQLQGMADEVSCRLLQLCQQEEHQDLKPLAYKCLCWGTTRECLHFLLRRVKENEDALSRTTYWVEGFREELWRRVKAFF